MGESELSKIDFQNIWHPYTQMKSHPYSVPIVRAKGVYLYTEDGKKIIDAVSSWWVNPHGHAHPYITKRITKQLKTLEHVIFAQFTHKPAIRLSQKILNVVPKNLKKVFFSDNGSTAVEVALKMCLQYNINKNNPSKNIILAFENSYHGDTFGAMGVSGVGLFNGHFKNENLQVKFIPTPKTQKAEDSIKALEKIDFTKVAGFIYEPLVQAASGMKMYSVKGMDLVLKTIKENNVLLVADEVFTGFGRTGKMFASDYLSTKPDIICLSKCLTGGVLPMGLTIATQNIYDMFYSDDSSKTLMHGHSFTANPIGCAAGLASIELFSKENTLDKIKKIESQNIEFLEKIKSFSIVHNPRVLGTILAFEVYKNSLEKTYFSEQRDKYYQYFLDRGALIRPLGNTIYVLPPYCIKKKQLQSVFQLIFDWLKTVEIEKNS